MKCQVCGAIMRLGDVYQGPEATPMHEACIVVADPAASSEWTLDNGEADDAAATAAEAAGE